MAGATGRVVDLAKEDPRDVVLVQGVLEAMCREAEVPSREDQENSDQGVKVGRVL